MAPSHRTLPDPAVHDWLVGGGEMGRLIRSMDWSRTPLGPIDSWTQSLRTTVSLCLASSSAIALAWGPRLVQIYNDGYRTICGAKHPDSMGQDSREGWATAFPFIGEGFERALAGETSCLEDQRVFLDRKGYAEETFFNFSFSPIRDETGEVGGVFHPVTETTGKMLADRRARALRDLAARTGKARTVEEVFTLAAETLAGFELDLPLALFYRIDAAGKEARLLAQAGLEPGTPASPAVVDLDRRSGASWPLAEVVRSRRACDVADLATRFRSWACGPYPESPGTALVLPILPPGTERPIGILVAGASARLPLDEAYRSFFDLVVAQVTTAVVHLELATVRRVGSAELERLNRELETFSYSVSHDLRAPLRHIDGFAGILADRTAAGMDATDRRYLDKIREAALRMSVMINELLAFSRAARTELKPSRVALRQIADEVIAELKPGLSSRTIEWRVGPLPEVEADRAMLRQVLENLIGNAVKYTSTRPVAVIEIGSTENDGAQAVVFVRDNGVGFDMKFATKLFGVFQRFHLAGEFEGNGIGLANVRRIVARHGGKTWAQAVVDRGATFFFSLPSEVGVPACAI